MKLQLIQTIALFGSLATAMPFMSISITITEEGTPASADVSSRPVHEKVSKKAHEPVLLPKNAGGARCYLLCEPSGEKANCPSDMDPFQRRESCWTCCTKPEPSDLLSTVPSVKQQRLEM